MDIQNAIYTSPENNSISAAINGKQVSVPVAPGNRHYDEMVELGITIAPYVAPVETYADRRTKNIADGGYGTFSEQLEIIGEQGISAFQSHIAAVKARHPK